MSVELKLDIGLCRCCHAQGMFQNLSTPFVCQGHEEIYSEMLRDCMNIMITPLEGEYSTSTYTICDTCALKLRDANEFKRQVLECEERFKEVCKEVMKSLEPMDVEIKQEMDDDDEDEDDQPIKHEPSDDDMDLSRDGFEVKIEELKEESFATLKEAKTEEQSKGRVRKPRLASTKAKPVVKVKKQNRLGMPKRQKKNTASNDAEATSATQKKTISKKKTAKQVADESKKGRLPEVPEEYTIEEDPQSGAKYYVCDRCGSRIKTLTSMRMHILNIHLKLPTFQCPMCSERFKYANTRNRHMSIVHGGERIRHPCQACDQVFLSRTALVQHIRNFHLQERPFKCDSCDMSFFSMVYLRRHMIKHTGERVYECKVCKKTFPRKNTLVLHERIHSNDRRFVCRFCNCAFVQKASLNYHMKKHHPELL